MTTDEIRAALQSGKAVYWQRGIHSVSQCIDGIQGQCESGCCQWSFESIDAFLAFLVNGKEHAEDIYAGS